MEYLHANLITILKDPVATPLPGCRHLVVVLKDSVQWLPLYLDTDTWWLVLKDPVATPGSLMATKCQFSALVPRDFSEGTTRFIISSPPGGKISALVNKITV